MNILQVKKKPIFLIFYNLVKVAHYPPYKVFAMRKSDAFVDIGLLVGVN